MKAEEFFEQKYGNKITANDSWVIRFAEEYANKDKWISVETNPEIGIAVIVGDINLGVVYNSLYYKSNDKWKDLKTGKTITGVTHYQYLPNPPTK